MAYATGLPFTYALRLPEYWLLLCVFSVVLGIGQTVSNNLADISAINSTAGIAFFSVGNSLGRFFPGYLSDMLIRECDRISCMIFATALLCTSQTILLLGYRNPIASYIGIFFTALAFGSYWVLMPAVLAEWFGRLHFGKIHGFLLLAAGYCGVAFIYNCLANLADALRGPCDNLRNTNACFDFKWAANLGLCMAAMFMAVVIKVRILRLERRAEMEMERASPSQQEMSLS
eukprot:gnl/TRDRNA2_/TRDRNA2_121594_c2_seq1.p1 gnl/TRDRNA2_/TRDRNA2_121594_c2~~gnl/TRDRNA2_/TRDRNA2_121594_c2_seq1.p1  ORF type:complete len:263 (-),score=36.95 gnl/TRDRNA2_/TRDRNA2_121594_c2_seq1:148-840(-)